MLWLLTGERSLRFTRTAPSRAALEAKLGAIERLGLYIHVPFCEQICPYCPYNKEIYSPHLAERYVSALSREMALYGDLVGNKPVTSLYIGGGTPTTLLHSGLDSLLGTLRSRFNLQCDIHMESHPNHLDAENLRTIKALGVGHLSIGVEALSDRHLKTLCRPYTAARVKEAVGRAVASGFTCVNVDVMFDLPGQTLEEIEETAHELVALGVDQVATYPMFRFAYTAMGQDGGAGSHVLSKSLKRRRMLAIFERVLYAAGFERSSTWAFTRRGVPRYCSVTVPLYLGLGASGGSYLRDVFYLNTFGVAEYCAALEGGDLPIALSVDLSERMQRAGWLYWRIYETAFNRGDYKSRFGEDIDSSFGRYLRLLGRIGFLQDNGECIRLSDRGSFWLHACEDIASIDYISRLWGASKREPWPDEVTL
jgi:oxygen-independent coproporphyrinogen-3 oxidase